MNINTWLILRMDEIKEAFQLKNKGESMIWLGEEYCMSIDEYIKDKIADVVRVIEDQSDKAVCENCDGTGDVKFISHQTEEYVEYELGECERCKQSV